MVAAAGAGMATIEHKFLGREARLTGAVVERGAELYQFVPARRGMHIDFDDAGVGCDLEQRQARVARRLVTFDHDRYLQLCGARFDGVDQFDVVGQVSQRRQEYMQARVADFRTQRGAHQAVFDRRRARRGRRRLAQARRLTIPMPGHERLGRREMIDYRWRFSRLIGCRRQGPHRQAQAEC